MSIALSATTLSFAQEKDSVSYYYRNLHCFDFVKQCELEIVKLKNRDTLIYVRSSQFHGRYDEIHGEMTRINDSIYYVTPFKHLAQDGNGNKPFYFHPDSVFFFCDSSMIGTELTIEYMNGRKEKREITSTEFGFWVNEYSFNKESERIYLSFEHKNPIVDETVEIASKYSEMKYSVVFKSERRLSPFYVIIRDKSINTINIGTTHHQTKGVVFELKTLPPGSKVPGNRTLYE